MLQESIEWRRRETMGLTFNVEKKKRKGNHEIERISKRFLVCGLTLPNEYNMCTMETGYQRIIC